MAVQTWRLEVSPLDVIETTFGTTWLTRMILTIILIGIWFWIERKNKISIKTQIPMLVTALILIATTTMMGHGASTEMAPPIILDYVHNLLSSIWIGGVIFFGFIVLPAITKLDYDVRDKITASLLPRFSAMIIIALGILIITGPTLLWFLDSNVDSLTGSTYGKLILAKIAIASTMIAFGGYYQIKFVAQAKTNLKSSGVYKKLQKPLRLEAGLGVALLAVVALLVNSSLPAGEIQIADALQSNYGFEGTLFSENAKFDVNVVPVGIGPNTISVTVSSFDDTPISDISGLKVKISNPQKNIAPIEAEVIEDAQNSIIKYSADTTFGFAGTWQIEIEAQRTQAVNEGVIFDVLVKPTLSEIRTEITEYDFPDPEAAPLYPRFDGNNTIWISDAAKPRIWEFNMVDQKFRSHEFNGLTTIFLDIDHDGKIWFTDTPNSKIGNFDPKTEKFETIKIPLLDAISEQSIPIAVKTDFQNRIWVALVDKHMLLVYNQNIKEFEKFLQIETEEAGPSALLVDDSGNVWFAEALAGKIGVVDSKTFEITEFSPEPPLDEPFALLFDKSGS